MGSPTLGPNIEFLEESPEIDEPLVQNWEMAPNNSAKNQVIDEIIDMLCREADQHPTQRFRYRLVVDEALTNAITHGRPEGTNPPVHVEFYQSESCFVLRVRDQGPGFRKEDLLDPTQPRNQMREHGRGVFIMDRYAARLAFAHGGREVTMWIDLED